MQYKARMDTILLSKSEAARMLGLSLRSLDHLIAAREIAVRRIGKRVLIARSAIEAFANSEDATPITHQKLAG